MMGRSDFFNMKTKFLIIISVTFAVFFLLVLSSGGMLLRLLYGNLQFLHPQKAIILSNNSILNDARLFRKSKLFNGKEVNRYVLIAGEKETSYEVFIINLDTNHVGVPNSNKSTYRLWLRKYLLHTDNGERYVRLSDGVKGWDFNPDSRIENKTISFTIPETDFWNYGRIKIQLK